MAQQIWFLSRLKFIFVIVLPVLLAGCQNPLPFMPTPTPSPTPIPTAGDVRIDAKGIEQVWVPAGSFMMGTDAADIEALSVFNPPGFLRFTGFPLEQPQHEVHLTQGYWIDKYEVTNKAFQAFV